MLKRLMIWITIVFSLFYPFVAEGASDREIYREEYEARINTFRSLVYLKVGHTLVRDGEYEKAFEKYEAALTLNPESDLAKNSMIFIKMHQREYEKAQNLYNDLVNEGLNPVKKSSIIYYVLFACSLLLVIMIAILQCVRFTDVKEIVKGRKKNKISLTDVREYKYAHIASEEAKVDVDEFFYAIVEALYHELENTSLCQFLKELLIKKKGD